MRRPEWSILRLLGLAATGALAGASDQPSAVAPGIRREVVEELAAAIEKAYVEPEMVQLLASYFLGPEPVLYNTLHRRGEGERRQLWTLGRELGMCHDARPAADPPRPTGSRGAPPPWPATSVTAGASGSGPLRHEAIADEQRNA